MNKELSTKKLDKLKKFGKKGYAKIRIADWQSVYYPSTGYFDYQNLVFTAVRCMPKQPNCMNTLFTRAVTNNTLETTTR